MGQVQAVLPRGLQPVVVTSGQNQNVVEIQDTQSSVPGLEGLAQGTPYLLCEYET